MKGNFENWFLVDPKDKNAINTLYERQTKITLGFFTGFIVCDVAAGMITTNVAVTEGLFTAVTLAVFAVFLIFYAAVAILFDKRRREIVRGNECKLTGSETDEVRLFLQKQYYSYHRTGNLVFGGFAVAGLIAGIVIAALCTDYSAASPAADFFTVTAAIALPCSATAFIPWVVIYVRYRRRTKPYEERVYELLTAYYEGNDGKER